MTTPSPYPGLRPFQQDEAHLFFGREAQIEDMLARLEDGRFLAVVGTSSCGKSSLVRAGLLPALEQGFLSDAEPNRRMAVMNPSSAPFDNLATALLSEAALGRERQHAFQAAALLQATLRRGPLGLVEAVAQSHLPEGTNLLLVVDQFEEIFRYRQQTPNVNDADAFVSLLLASVQSQQSEVPIYVVITMRSDFIGDCALFTGLPEAINDSQFLTPRLTRDQYRSAIVEPALLTGGQLTDALVNQLLNDLRGEPDQLPVLQHALMRMWTQDANNASARTLTLDDYKAVGGLAGALSKHCDEILYNELNAEQQRIAQVMFRALCERSSAQRDTRRPVRLGEVAAIAEVEVEAVKPVVEAFRAAGRNFLTPPLPIPLNAETTADISHESLIRQWQTLNAWVVAEAESARQYQRLEDAAKRRQQRRGAELWRGVDLENARIWKEREKPTEAWAKRYGDAYQLAMDFLQESEAEEEKQRSEHEQAHQRELEQVRERAELQRIRAEEQAARAAEQARAARRFKAITVVVGILLLMTIGVAIYAISQRNKAATAQQHAEKAQLHAEEKEQEAIRAAEEAERQRMAAETATKEADQQRQVAVVRLARYFSAASKASIEAQPTLGILLSIEAVKTALIPAAEEALRDAITKIASTALVGHEEAVYGVAFSPDGQVLATGSEDRAVRLWSLSNPAAESRVLRGHEGPVYGVAFSPDGQVLATASGDKTVRLWSLSNPMAEPRVLRGHTDTVGGVAFSSDGQVLATTSRDKTVRLWSLSNPMAEPRVLRGHKEAVWGVTFSSDGQVLATASGDKTVRLWSLSNPTVEPRMLQSHEGAIWGVAFSSDGQVLATAGGDKTVRLWFLHNPAEEPRVLRGHKGQTVGVAFSPDGQVLATASTDKTVRLWSLSNPTAEPHVLRGHEEAVGVAFSPDGQVLATTSWDKTVRLWSLSNPTVEPRVLRGHEGPAVGVAFSPDSQVLATASWDKTVRLWSLSNPTAEPHVLRGHEGPVYGVAFSPDGQVLATTSWDKTVRLWSLSNPTVELRVLRGHKGLAVGVAFSPDGQVLATASGDSTVRLWSLSNPTAEPRVLRGHEGPVYGVAFSPDGQVLATASEDKTVRLWSLSNPTAEPRVLRGHTGRIESVAFSPDGRVLATASGDNTVRLWSIVIDDVVRIACLLSSSNFSYKEWQLYMGDEPYRKTCQNRPLPPSFLEIIWRQVKNGDVEGGVAKLLKALQADGTSDVALQKEERRLAAPWLVDKGRKLAREGDIDGAEGAFQQALALDPNLGLDPGKEARRLAASGLVDKGEELAEQGAIREAMAAFAAAQASDPNLEIAAASWYSLCWFGSLGGFATDVMAACERAVALAPDDGNIHDSRAVARALTGDYSGAIQDFQQYLEWGPKNGQPEEQIRQRQDWLRLLQANQNPFNEELLKLLRDQ
jgi:WD40 repeat protein